MKNYYEELGLERSKRIDEINAERELLAKRYLAGIVQPCLIHHVWVQSISLTTTVSLKRERGKTFFLIAF